MRKLLQFVLNLSIFWATISTVVAQSVSPSSVLPERERSRVIDEILEDRFNQFSSPN